MAGSREGSNLTKWAGRVVLVDSVIDYGVVITDGAKIAWVGEQDDLPEQWARVPAVEVPGSSIIMPGLIDVHNHGGGGASFPDVASIKDVAQAADEHLRHGTTTLIASLVTAPVDVLEQRASVLADATEAGIIQGIHYEGPCLSEIRCGAQDPTYLIPATPDVARRLVKAARGYAVTMTIAPERVEDEAGREAIEILIEGGILPSWGHTDAGIPSTEKAIKHGLEVLKKQTEEVRGGKATITHLFNGMRPLHHRDPGPISALLAHAQKGNIFAEMINDGIHLNPRLVAEVAELVGKENCVFVTDAMAATGMADGIYVLGPQEVRVEDGVARLLHGDAIAGGTSHILDCVRQGVQHSGLSLVDSVYLGTVQGAKVLGLEDRGRLEAGLRADLVVTDEDLRPLVVVRAGEVVA